MISFSRLCLIVASAVSLGACTTNMSTLPDFARTSREQALPGIAYALPMLQYEIVTAYKIVECPQPARGATPESKLEVVVTPIAASDYVAAERYVIDYRALTSLLKTTDFAIETYEGSGTLKSLNASIEDKTGDVVKAVVDTAISGATMLSGAPIAAGQNGGDQAYVDALKAATVKHVALKCTDAALAKLNALAAARSRIKVLRAELDQGVLTAETIGARAALKMSAANDGADLLKLHGDQLARSAELTRLQADVSETEAAFSFVETIRWPTKFGQRDGPITSSARLRAWASKFFDVQSPDKAYEVTDTAILAGKVRALETADAQAKVSTPNPAIQPLRDTVASAAPDYGCGIDEDIEECVGRAIGLHASLRTEEAPLPNCPEPSKREFATCVSESGVAARDDILDKGVFVREPVRARLLLCGHSTPCADTAEKSLFEGRPLMAPQLGQLRFLKFSNGPFQNNALTLSLRTDGGITKMQYTEKSAIAAVALASVSASAGSLEKYLKERDAEREKALDDAKADATAARVEAKAVRDDDIAQLQYQFDKVTKEKAIFDQANPTPPEEPAVAKAVANENLRLQAEMTRWTALLAIKKAMAEYAQ